MGKLKGRVALVTGGASGLGQAVVKRLRSNGCQVVVVDLQLPDEIANDQHAEGGQIRYFVGDITNEGHVQEAIDYAVQIYNGLHILVNCAGIVAGSKIVGRSGGIVAPHSLELFQQIINVNVVGTFNAMRLAAFAMQANRPGVDGERGVIINTSSIAAFDGQIGQVAYAASKGAIASMTLPAARDLASTGIRVVSIAPGLFRTPLLGDLPEEVVTSLENQVPFPSRLGNPEEFAELVDAIISNRMLNGEVIRLDGAVRMAPK